MRRRLTLRLAAAVLLAALCAPARALQTARVPAARPVVAPVRVKLPPLSAKLGLPAQTLQLARPVSSLAPAKPVAPARAPGAERVDVSALRSSIDAAADAKAPGKLKDFVDRLFDRIGLFPARQAPTPALMRQAAPFKTGLQLRRLERSPRKKNETFRFAVIGDSEPGRFWIFRALFNKPGMFPKLMRLLKREPVDFSIQLGDMVSLGSVRNYAGFFKTLRGLLPLKPYLTAIGNHDRRFPHGVTDNKLYRALFGPSDYFFDRGGYRFVVVDDSAQRLTPKQLAWLDAALDTRLKTMVFMHIPPNQLAAWADYAWMKGVGGFKTGSRRFTEIVSRRGVSRVYLGHVHGFGTAVYKGVRYVLTGGGGSPLFPSGAEEKVHHFLTVEAGPKGIKEIIHKADGTVAPVP